MSTERMVYDIRLMADGQAVSFIVEDGAITAVHLSKKRLTPEAIEELAIRVREAEFDHLKGDDDNGS